MFKPLPFNLWISDLIGIIYFLADRTSVEKKWVAKDKKIPGIEDFDETYEVLIGDMESSKNFMVYSRHPSLSPEQQRVLGEFLRTFEDTNNKATHGKRREHVDSVALLHSNFWPPLEEAAKAVVKAFEGWKPPLEEKK